jgi:hypothetical protein
MHTVIACDSITQLPSDVNTWTSALLHQHQFSVVTLETLQWLHPCKQQLDTLRNLVDERAPQEYSTVNHHILQIKRKLQVLSLMGSAEHPVSCCY